MKLRSLSYQVQIRATKTRCGRCHFQHSEWHGCILFGKELPHERVRVDPRFELDDAERPGDDGKMLANLRLEECKRAEREEPKP